MLASNHVIFHHDGHISSARMNYFEAEDGN